MLVFTPNFHLLCLPKIERVVLVVVLVSVVFASFIILRLEFRHSYNCLVIFKLEFSGSPFIVAKLADVVVAPTAQLILDFRCAFFGCVSHQGVTFLARETAEADLDAALITRVVWLILKLDFSAA